ncbi:uncharacterized protein LOC132300098 isoform X2 [Cornus florida]|uniref:uncharacterized protein LOC132300098 isoform X2 n=1 Tax=Cornus florida TaxID=4283 RepID=UPI0028976812|nr:uncharacterized protein LOC132300098 isoform X2 [Cornus florida]
MLRDSQTFFLRLSDRRPPAGALLSETLHAIEDTMLLNASSPPAGGAGGGSFRLCFALRTLYLPHISELVNYLGGELVQLSTTHAPSEFQFWYWIVMVALTIDMSLLRIGGGLPSAGRGAFSHSNITLSADDPETPQEEGTLDVLQRMEDYYQVNFSSVTSEQEPEEVEPRVQSVTLCDDRETPQEEGTLDVLQRMEDYYQASEQESVELEEPREHESRADTLDEAMLETTETMEDLANFPGATELLESAARPREHVVRLVTDRMPEPGVNRK